VFGCPEGTVAVNTGGTWATAVWVGNGAKEVAAGKKGVFSWASNEVFVGDGRDGGVGVAAGTLVCVKEDGVRKDGAGVLVRGCKRYDPVIAIDVLVLLAFRTASSLAGPPEAIQSRINRAINRPVTPSACK
jgi:hypothetical protein